MKYNWQIQIPNDENPVELGNLQPNIYVKAGRIILICPGANRFYYSKISELRDKMTTISALT